MKGKYLITANCWFFAPDGKQYKAAWGDVEIFDDKVLGVATNKNSTNWYAKIGSDDKHVIMAGCQIHYAVRCETQPSTEPLKELRYSDALNKSTEVDLPNSIYIAQ